MQSDSYVAAAGYANMYGYMTWCNYLAIAALYENANAEPIQDPRAAGQCAKDSVTNFMNYISAAAQDDRMGLSVYTYSDSTAILEQSLTPNYSSISGIVAGLQAGNYIGGTNI